MSWDAVDALDDARAATQSLLLPISVKQWLRLALVTFFVGGFGGAGGGGAPAQGAFSTPAPPGTELDPRDIPALGELPVSDGVVGVVLFLLAFVLVLVVVYAFVGAVMEFVLVEGCRTRSVDVNRPFRQFLGPGLRLFVFRVGLLAVVTFLVSAPLLFLVSEGFDSVSILVVVSLLVLAGGGASLTIVVGKLTTDFVVPTMVAEGRTVLSAWRRALPLLRSEWAEVGLYLVVRFALGIAASVAVGLIVGLAGLVVAVPFVLVGSLVVITVGVQGAGLAVLAVLAVLFVGAVAIVSVVTQIPVVTYFRYYSLFLLGTFDERLNLLAPTSTPRSKE